MIPDPLAFGLGFRLGLVVALVCTLPYWFGVFSLLHLFGVLSVGAVDFGVQAGLQEFRPR